MSDAPRRPRLKSVRRLTLYACLAGCMIRDSGECGECECECEFGFEWSVCILGIYQSAELPSFLPVRRSERAAMRVSAPYPCRHPTRIYRSVLFWNASSDMHMWMYTGRKLTKLPPGIFTYNLRWISDFINIYIHTKLLLEFLII